MTLFAIFYSIYYQTILSQTAGVRLAHYTQKKKWQSNNTVNPCDCFHSGNEVLKPLPQDAVLR